MESIQDFDKIYSRLLYAAKVQTQVELATVLEISQSSISDAKRRQSIPSDWLIKIYDKFGVSPDWLRWRREPMYLNGGKLDEDFLSDQDELLCGKGTSLVSVYSTACRELNGSPDYRIVESTMLPVRFQEQSDLVFLYKAGGMDPYIKKNALVGVSTTENQVISGDIFALYQPPEGIVFRRIIQDCEEGRYLLCFEQDSYPMTHIALDSLQQKMIGRVMWTIQSL